MLSRKLSVGKRHIDGKGVIPPLHSRQKRSLRRLVADPGSPGRKRSYNIRSGEAGCGHLIALKERPLGRA